MAAPARRKLGANRLPTGHLGRAAEPLARRGSPQGRRAARLAEAIAAHMRRSRFTRARFCRECPRPAPLCANDDETKTCREFTRRQHVLYRYARWGCSVGVEGRVTHGRDPCYLLGCTCDGGYRGDRCCLRYADLTRLIDHCPRAKVCNRARSTLSPTLSATISS